MTASDHASGPTAAEGDSTLRASPAVAFALLVAGLLGSAAAAVLLVEKFALLTNPFYVPSCTINAAVSCSAVMTSPQAEAFGFPNPVIGLATFPVVAAVGAAVLAGARMRSWFWVCLAGGSLLGWAFVHWLIVQSVFVIGALCPYCMVVWVCVAVAAVSALAVLSRAGRAPAVIGRYGSSIVLGWIGLVAVLVAGSVAGIWGA